MKHGHQMPQKLEQKLSYIYSGVSKKENLGKKGKTVVDVNKTGTISSYQGLNQDQ